MFRVIRDMFGMGTIMFVESLTRSHRFFFFGRSCNKDVCVPFTFFAYHESAPSRWKRRCIGIESGVAPLLIVKFVVRRRLYMDCASLMVILNERGGIHRMKPCWVCGRGGGERGDWAD